MKDRTGNAKSVFVTLGASSHTEQERQEHDYYATHPDAVRALLKESSAYIQGIVWEPAAGKGHIVRTLKKYTSAEVVCSDKYQYGYPLNFQKDFLKMKEAPLGVRTIITNPPYKYATEFVLKSLELLPEGGLCYMLLRTLFLEGRRRYERIFEKYPPLTMYQFIERVDCPKNGDFDRYAECASPISYAWFLWVKGFTETTRIKWLTTRGL